MVTEAYPDPSEAGSEGGRALNLFPNVNFLDCTLRDGGYYNNWDFSREFTSAYLETLFKIGVSQCEIGFRSLQSGAMAGPWAFSPESVIQDLDIPKEISIGVMLNASEFRDHTRESIDLLFKDSNVSRVSFVRVAATQADFATAELICNALKEKGYRVFVNVMQMHNMDFDAFGRLSESLDFQRDIIYFADSFGNMLPWQISNFYKSAKKYWQGELGLHAHDNFGLALANSMAAVDAGATWIDGTMMGIGRGPGNTKIDELLALNRSDDNFNDFTFPLWSFLDNHVAPLRNEYKWGSSPLYSFAAHKLLHPSYIQTALETSNVLDEDHFLALKRLSENAPKKFSQEILNETKQVKFETNAEGDFPDSTSKPPKEILIIANTQDAIDVKNYLELYCKVNNPMVISVNVPNPEIENLVNLVAVIHPMRLAELGDHLSEKKYLIVAPKHFSETVSDSWREGNNYLNYEASVIPGVFETQSMSCTIPAPLGLIYALALSESLNADKISLVGFSGKDLAAHNKEEMNSCLVYLNDRKIKSKIRSLTPTYLKCDSVSIFSQI
jgi:4-hydroxy 2-oxovalerate aldolase